MRYLFAFVAISLLSFTAHKFYVSNTLLAYNEMKQSFEITMKIFTDDLEIAAEKTCEKKLRLGDKREFENADQILEEYIRKNFSVIINDSLRSYQWIGKEVELDQIFIYFEIQNVIEVTSIEVSNSLLCEEFEEQINMVDCTVYDVARNIGLTRETPSGLLYKN